MQQVEKLGRALAALEGADGATRGRTLGTGKRKLSAAARKKMSLGQKARWARVAKTKNQMQSASGADGSSVPRKRTMSLAARRKIAAAQKKRWAKVRAKG
jgi:hypothetical protein